ncbi:MAG: 1-deoxy-D-xylulose-5-phosphate reductoisomerase, partial [SAR202 cluster bacterium]|nr:1-deoxy-D-xylulose-5-phosphate reductoisomerase [SAR202 cluster bacterium]
MDHFPEKFDIKYLSAHNNINKLIQQASKYEPDTVCIVNEEKKADLENGLMGTNINVVSGREALLDISSRNDIDLVINGLVGSQGMEPTIRVIKSNVNLALANKESLVMAGEIINQLLEKS